MNYPVIIAAIGAILLLSRKGSSYNAPVGNFSDVMRWRDLAAENANGDIGEADILAVIANESWGNPEAVPPGGGAGEIGLMQVTFPAFSDVDSLYNLPYSHKDLKGSPERQIFVGVAYLKMMYARFQTLELAVRAYNQGPGNISRDPSKGQEYWDRFLRNKNRVQERLINV